MSSTSSSTTVSRILPVGPDYNIRIGPIGQQHFDWLEARNYAGWVVLVDENTGPACLPLLKSFLAGKKYVVITTPEGELHKNLDTCQQIWTEMFQAGAGRRWCTLNLGGGVLTDMGGFCASTFKRGMDFIQVPTTLLSQVDASVGGKLGIDFHQVKNSIGLFANPEAVWVDTRFFETLPPRELRSGFAEIIKHALIASREQWDYLLTIKSLDQIEDWDSLIHDSVTIKRDVVLEDPYEHGLRKALNFGHTVGHAIESYFLETERRLLHGEAIAAGMICEAWLSVRHSTLSEQDLGQITAYLLYHYGHQAIPEAALPELIDLMRQDKKNEDARINFTLLKNPGEAVVNATAGVGEIKEAITYYNRLQ